MRDKIKIALIVAETAPVPDVLGGGAERLVTMLIDQNEIDKKVKFIVASKYDKNAKKIAARYENTSFLYLKNINPFSKLYNGLIRFANGVIKTRFRKHGYYNIIAERIDQGCDVIIDQNGYCREIGFLCDNFGKEKILAHVHWKVNPSIKEVDSFYGGIIGVSDYITNYWLQNSNEKNTRGMTVYSAIDEKRFKKAINTTDIIQIKNEFGINETDFIFIYCGRLHEQKGVRELIKAFLNLNFNNVKLLIVGGSYLKNTSISDYEREIRCLAKENSNVIFAGYVDNEKLAPYYRLSDVQIIPTLVDEAAGLVAIEGMYSGLPIIATNSGGLPEYLDEHCAVLVDKGANIVNGLCEAMSLLYNDKTMLENMAEASIRRSKMFTQKKYYDDFIECIEKYIAQKGI